MNKININYLFNEILFYSEINVSFDNNSVLVDENIMNI